VGDTWNCECFFAKPHLRGSRTRDQLDQVRLLLDSNIFHLSKARLSIIENRFSKIAFEVVWFSCSHSVMLNRWPKLGLKETPKSLHATILRTMNPSNWHSSCQDVPILHISGELLR
jgi:hypothetical protein